VTAIAQYSSTQICSASHDKTIRLWNVETGLCAKAIYIQNRIESLEVITAGVVAIVTTRHFLEFWAIDQDIFIKSFDLQENLYVHMVKLSSGNICTCTMGNIVTIWNYKDYTKIKSFVIPSTTLVDSLQLLDDDRLAIIFDDNDIVYIFNWESGEFDQELGEEYPTRTVQLGDGRLCCIFDYMINVWN
jgi:WD40 repeat protein